MPRRRTAAITALAAATIAAPLLPMTAYAGGSGIAGPDAASYAGAPRAAAPAPVVAPAPGTCWSYDYATATRSTYSGTPVDCAEAHTVETAVNLDVPDDIAKGGNASRNLVLWVDARCQVEVNTYAGIAKPETAAPGTRTWYFWYTPTQRDWKAGNHWVSCAAGSVPVSMNKKGAVVPVTGSIAGAADLSKVRTFTTDYGLGRYVARKPMTELASRPYPGTAGLQSDAWKFCKKAVGSNKYFWYGPSEQEWVDGWTAIKCFAKVKS